MHPERLSGSQAAAQPQAPPAAASHASASAPPGGGPPSSPFANADTAVQHTTHYPPARNGDSAVYLPRPARRRRRAAVRALVRSRVNTALPYSALSPGESLTRVASAPPPLPAAKSPQGCAATTTSCAKSFASTRRRLLRCRRSLTRASRQYPSPPRHWRRRRLRRCLVRRRTAAASGLAAAACPSRQATTTSVTVTMATMTTLPAAGPAPTRAANVGHLVSHFFSNASRSDIANALYFKD